MPQPSTPAKQNVLSESKLKLTAAPQQGSKKKPTLAVKVYQNNPRLEVRTNVPNDRDFGRITAALDSFTFFGLLDLIDKVSKGASDTKYVLNNQSTYINGQKVDQPQVATRVVVGKDKEGITYLAVTAKDRPMIKFNLMPSEWHFLNGPDGQAANVELVSQAWAAGWCNVMKQLVPTVLTTEFAPNEFTPNRAGGGPNKWNNKQQRPSSQSDSMDESGDEDLPF